jgi:hypothetical protein
MAAALSQGLDHFGEIGRVITAYAEISINQKTDEKTREERRKLLLKPGAYAALESDQFLMNR